MTPGATIYRAYPAPVAGWVAEIGGVQILGESILGEVVIAKTILNPRTGATKVIPPCFVFEGEGHPIDSGAAVDTGNLVRFTPPPKLAPEQISLFPEDQPA